MKIKPGLKLIKRNSVGKQVFILVAIEPVIRADGRKTRIGIWRANCRKCGEVYFITSSLSRLVFRDPRGQFATVHCVPHRKWTTAAARDAVLAAKYGKPQDRPKSKPPHVAEELAKKELRS
jgi:hypothetical protein